MADITLDEFVALLPPTHSAALAFARLKDNAAISRFPEGEAIAALFARNYQKMAVDFGIDPAVDLPVPVVWNDLPPQHRRLMVAVSVVTLNEVRLSTDIEQPPPI